MGGQHAVLQEDGATEKLLMQLRAEQAAMRSQMEEQSTLLRAMQSSPTRYVGCGLID